MATALIGELLSALREGDTVRLMTVTPAVEAVELYRKVGLT